MWKVRFLEQDVRVVLRIIYCVDRLFVYRAHKTIMYTAIAHLQTAIRQALHKGAICRIYPESLDACWPGISAEERTARVERFAAQNHWQVTIREVGSLGVLAEFSKAEAFQRAA